VRIAGAVRKAVLIELLLAPNTFVPAASIIADLWPSETPGVAGDRLQAQVRGLRRSLGHTASRPLLDADEVGYRLRVEPGALDTVRARDEITVARDLLASGDAYESRRRLAHSLAMWRGDPLADVADHLFAQPEIRRLRELWLTAVEAHAEAGLAVGDHRTVATELEQLVDEEPLREALWVLLIAALQRSGRTVDARHRFEQARSQLAEAGLVPSPLLRRLEQQIVLEQPAPDLVVASPDDARWTLDVGGTRSTNARTPPAGLLTFLFTDVVDSTVLWEQSPGGMAEALASHDDTIRACVAGCDGYIFSTAGDGFGAAFRLAADALEAARRIQREMAHQEHDGQRGNIERLQLRVRIGAHTGPAEHRGGNFFGRTLNRASRVMATARGGQIVVTDATAKVLPRRLRDDLVDLGRRTLRGIPEPMRLYRADRLETTTGAGHGSTVAGREEMRVSAATVQTDDSLGVLPDDPAAGPLGADSLTGLPRVLADLAAAPMIGRRAANVRARRAWEEATRGNPRLLLVQGPAGIGKTHLAATVARHAAAEGALVAYGRCDTDPLQAYEPFVRILEDCYERDPAATKAATADRSPLVRLLPRLRLDGVTDIEPATDPDLERLRLFDAVAGLFVELTQNQPLCVVIDDLEWADGSTARLLRFLMTNLQSCRVLFIATCRSPYEVSALDDLLPALDREGVIDHLSVPGLSVADTEELLVLVAPGLGSSIADLAPTLHQLSEGNPFYAREIARHLRASPDSTMPADPIETLLASGVPATIDASLRQRLDGLSEVAQAALAAGSVSGVEFTLDRVQAITSMPRAQLINALDEAERTGAVAVDDAGLYRFTHRLFRETVYRALPRLQRAQLHAATAAAIELASADVEDRVMGLARHHCAAIPVTDPATAVAWLRRSAERAQRQAAFSVAAQELERAVSLLDRHGCTADDLCRTLVDLGAALHAAGEPARSRTAYERAAALAIKHSLPRSLADAAIGACGTWTGNAPDPEVIRGVEEAVAALEVIHAERAVADELRRVLGRLAVMRFRAFGDPDAHGLALRAMGMGTDRAIDEGRFEALHAMHVTSVLREPPAFRRTLVQEMIDHAALAPDPANRVVAAWEAIGDALESGAPTDLEPIMNEFEDIGAASGRPVDLWSADVIRACVATARGELIDAERYAHRTIHSGAGIDPNDVWDVHVLQLFVIRWYQRRAAELIPLIEAAAAREGSRAPATVGLGLVAFETGRTDDAHSAIDTILDGKVRFVANEHWLGWMCMVAYLASRIGHRAAALELLPQLERHTGGHALIGRSIVWMGSVSLFTGLLAAATGDSQRARDDLTDALEQNQAASLPFWTTEAQRALRELEGSDREDHALPRSTV
jgi:class 3 adenylate cyclase